MSLKGLRDIEQFKSKIPREILMRYQEDCIEHSRASSVLTKLRLLGDHPNATDEQALAYMRGKRVYKEACKKYTNDRARFAAELGALNLNVNPDKINFKGVRETIKEEVLKDEVFNSSFEEKYRDIIEAARNHPSVKAAEKTSENENLSDEPPAGDFEPLE